MPQRRHCLGTTALALVLGSAGPAAADAVLDGSTGSSGTFSGLLDDYDHPFFWAPFLLIGNWL